MRIHGLLCFFDEPVESLVAALAGLRSAGVDSIVAVDGAYALYPNARAASAPNQHAAITLACRELGMSCLLHVPSEPWAGNEVEKRTHLFALGQTVAEEGDWFWVQDADMVTTESPFDLKDRLAATDCLAAEVTILDVVAQAAQQKDWPAEFVMRSLFRAQPIHVDTHHARYVDAEGRHLWNGNGNEQPVAGLDLSDVVTVEHRPHERPAERQRDKLAYYAQRDAARVERGKCKTCGADAMRLVPINWRWSDIGPVAEWQEACEPHAEEVGKVARFQLQEMGIDPDSVVAENRNGKAPA